jgi:hypothetical protein
MKSEELYDKITLPQDFVVLEPGNPNPNRLTLPATPIPTPSPGCQLVDLGPSVTLELQTLHSGSLFLIDVPYLSQTELGFLQLLCRILAAKKEAKQVRHIQEQGTASGINYEKDLVVYVVGVEEAIVEGLELRERKAKKVRDAEQDEEEEEP